MNSYSNAYGRQGGFSYLWLLFLVALLGVGLAAIGEEAGMARRRQQERQLLFVGHQMRDAIQRYRENTPQGQAQEYPARLDDLLDDRRNPVPVHHLRRRYIDPITGSPDWGLVWMDSRIVGIYSRSAAEPAKQDNFDGADAGFKDAKRYADWQFTYPARLPDGASVLLR